MDVRCLSLGMLGLTLFLTSCAQCRWGTDAAGSAQPQGATACSSCPNPHWYWSNGKYHPFFDNSATCAAAEKCAVRSFKQYRGTVGPHESHFRCGYIQSFVDVAFGSNGVIPAVPPQKYWKAHNRTAVGYARSEAWFQGYRAGAADAMAMDNQNYLHIPTSGEVNLNNQPSTPYWGPARPPASMLTH